MSDSHATIRSKSCEATGLDEDLAKKMHGQVGKHYMAIVELLVVEKHGPSIDGKKRVDLTIEQIEPAGIGSDLDTHLRDLTRAAYLSRGQNGQPTLTAQSDVEPTVEEVTKAGKRLEPHDFEPTAEGDRTICDVCGEDDDDPRHSAEVLNQVHDPANPEAPGDKDLETAGTTG